MSRTIIVGDVHGCRLELEALLDRVGFRSGDRLVFVGDLVARGPDSLGVLDIARRTGALFVRGNHEQKLLDWRHGGGRLGRLHLELAEAMRDVDWTLLEASPFWLDLPEHDARIVHAGVLPGVPLDEQHPETLMTLRTVGPRGEAPRKKRRSDLPLWGERWPGPTHVVFGHNALPGLQLHPFATGLDTGCVYGGKLTALVLEEGENVCRGRHRRRDQLIAEPARRAWFVAGRRKRAA